MTVIKRYIDASLCGKAGTELVTANNSGSVVVVPRL